MTHQTDQKYQGASIPTIPEDEPIFILRAKDAASVPLLNAYVVLCGHLGSPDEHLLGLRELISDFSEWQNRHETKIPD